MSGALVASHDQALHAIGERLEQPGTDPLLRTVVAGVITLHLALPSPTGRPNPDCEDCHGTGQHKQFGLAVHCHCRCPWCTGCDEPVCGGPCPTVEVIADRLGLL
ncbi:hypothetical protein [Micromonospora sp. WMMD998]|uniref:hypothetical protein n=1 Tax=Micromonospora sp. WMMD998 TaxID=3016092 RepID=UPI00249A7FB5|nr:hypothetical protein [Micromonospora sp. WMMD998]WFE41932.1 hypothetical protein O7619_27190 [Micromonospora sp. WMMD998]